MSVEMLLPPYTEEERNRELSMRSRALRWRTQRALNQNRQLRGHMAQLLDNHRALSTSLDGKPDEGEENRPPAC